MSEVKDKNSLKTLTEEQKARADREYLDAVNQGVNAAVKQADEGKLVPDSKAWEKLGLEH